MLDYPDGNRVFEVYRKFTPTERPRAWMHGSGMMRRRMANGLQFNTSYVFGKGYQSDF